MIKLPNYIKEKYELIDSKKLGSGAFGKVYRIRDKKVFNEFVLKKISKEDTDKKYFEKEKNFLLKVKGVNIVKLIDYYEDDEDDSYYFVFEKMEGDLNNLLNKKYKNGMPLEMIKKIFLQLNSAFKIMKNFGITHRDLKPDNILYSYIDSNKNDFIIKLADFGLATNLKSTKIATLAGTPGYIAPEIFTFKYSDKCDLYSLGIILYKLKTGEYIFGNSDEEIYNNMKKNNLKKTGDKLLDDLIKKIVVFEPKDRINWDEYFNHPFFKCKIFDLLLDSNQKYINGIIYY